VNKLQQARLVEIVKKVTRYSFGLDYDDLVSFIRDGFTARFKIKIKSNIPATQSPEVIESGSDEVSYHCFIHPELALQHKGELISTLKDNPEILTMFKIGNGEMDLDLACEDTEGFGLALILLGNYLKLWELTFVISNLADSLPTV